MRSTRLWLPCLASATGLQFLFSARLSPLPPGLFGYDESYRNPFRKVDLPRARQTARILAAMDNPHVSILAHPTGRLLEARAPYDVDLLAIVRKAFDLYVAFRPKVPEGTKGCPAAPSISGTLGP